MFNPLSCHHICSRAVLFVACFLLSPVFATPQQTTATGNLTTSTPGLNTIKARIAELEPSSSQEGADTRALENYRQVLVQHQAAEKEQQQALVYKEIVDNADKQLSQLRRTLSLEQKKDKAPTLSPKLAIEELTQRHNRAQSNRQKFQAQLKEQQDQQIAERIRPEQSGEELAVSKRELDLLTSRLVAPASSDMTADQRELLLATQSMLKNRINRLKRVFDLVKDFGTSQSPKSTRSSTTY